MTPIASPSSNFGDGQGGDFPSQNAPGEQNRPGVAFLYIHQILNEEHVTYQFRNPGMIPLQEFLMSIPRWSPINLLRNPKRVLQYFVIR